MSQETDQRSKGNLTPKSSAARLRSVKLPNWRRLPRPKLWLAGLGVVLAVGFGFLGGWVASSTTGSNSLNAPDLSSQKQVVSSQSQLISQIAKNVGQSVVSVNVTSQQQSSNSFFGMGGGGTQEQQSAGTGIILSSDGLIITNRHVVPAGTTSVSVTLADGTTLNNVKVVGRTPDSDTLDIAFLKVTDAKGHKLVPAELGDSSKVKVGDAVVAIGNALGQFQNTVTSGIISGYGRSVQASDAGSGANSENLTDLFQTDAAINEGNSGGPLVNLNGQVIGINTAIAGNAENIGFAIPINDAKGLIKQVLDTGQLKRPYLGVRYVPITDDYAYEFNLPVNRGAYIPPSSDFGSPSIISGSPADKAGLKEKDIITAVNGTQVDENNSLTALLSKYQPGNTVDLTIIRQGKTIHIKVQLGTAPSDNS